MRGEKCQIAYSPQLNHVSILPCRRFAMMNRAASGSGDHSSSMWTHLKFRYNVTVDAARTATATAITDAVTNFVGGRSVRIVFRFRRCHADAMAGDNSTTTLTT